MRIAHFGTFDVENYGDLLFPLILERRLSDICEEIVHVSPAGGPPVWKDCVPTIGFDEFLGTPGNVDGVIVGGGQVVRTAPTSLKTYDRGGVSAFTTYPSVWLGAAYVAAQHDAPLCWNAPGVSTDFGPVATQLVQWTASVTDYLAVRDETSHHSLERAGVSQDINVVLDSAAEVSDLWEEEEISDAYQQAFVRHNRRVPRRTLAFHVNSRWAGEEAAAVAARIDRICKKLDATPILLGIGPCHGDDEVQRQVSREMDTGPLVIDRPQSLLEITACIARSDAYFGSSLHGMIAACSFGTRGMLVASKKDNKYTGFLDHLDLSSWLVDSWEAAEKRADELSATPGEHWKQALDATRPNLEGHWDHLREVLATYRRNPSRDDKRGTVEQLQHIGDDNFSNLQIFQPLLTEKLEESQEKLQATRIDLEEVSYKLRQERQKLRWTRQNLMLLRRWMETVDEAVQALWASRQWKAGHALGELQRRLLRKPKQWTAREQFDSQLQKFRNWNEDFERSEEDPPEST